jgi:hypothetical protein
MEKAPLMFQHLSWTSWVLVLVGFDISGSWVICKFRNQALESKQAHERKSRHHRYVFTEAGNPSKYCRNTSHQTSNCVTAWRTVCSETLILVQLIKKFLTCHGFWRFVAVSTTTSQWHYDDLHESSPHNKSCSILTQFFDICLGFGLSLPVCV